MRPLPNSTSSPGQRLHRERQRLNWSQERLAAEIGVSAMSINRWEHDKVLPQAYYREQLCRVFNVSAETLFGTAAGQEGAPPTSLPIWNIPYQQNPFFTGREKILGRLHEALRQERTATLTQSYALSGLGGIGKTQTALEYAYRHSRDYAAVFWIGAETYESLVSSFVVIADLLNLPEKQEQEQSKIVAAVTRWLNSHSDWLLIFDNVEQVEVVTGVLPAARRGSLLFTSRIQALGITAHTLDLEQMMPEEGMHFLLRRARLLDPAASLEQLSPTDEAIARELVAAMGGLPLSLDQAGAYIEATRCSLSDYLLLFQSSRQRLLDERDAHADHPLSVTRTFTLAFEQLERSNASAAELLRACAFLAPEGIPETFFIEGAASLGPTFVSLASDPFQFNAAVKALLSYSLLQRHATTHTLTIHRLVQAVLKGNMSEAIQRTWVARLIDAMTQLFPAEQETQADYWQVCEQLLPHALECVTLSDQWGEEGPERATLMSHVATYLSSRVRFAEAESLFQRALRIREHALGPEHPLVASSLNNLASIYLRQSKYEQAEPLFQRALRTWEYALGPEHPRVAASLNNLAELYKEQGKYEQAEPLFQRALRIWEQVMGPEDPDVAFALHGLAELYREQGRYGQAEPLYQRALRIWEQAVPGHIQVAELLTGLAELYKAQEQHEQAEPLYQRALRIWEQALPEHPRVASSLQGLAELYREQGKYEQAEPLFQRALALRQQH